MGLYTISQYKYFLYDYGFKDSSFKVEWGENYSDIYIIFKKQFFRYLFYKKRILKYIEENRTLGIVVKMIFAIR